jgi:hypothetical protein
MAEGERKHLRAAIPDQDDIRNAGGKWIGRTGSPRWQLGVEPAAERHSGV